MGSLTQLFYWVINSPQEFFSTFLNDSSWISPRLGLTLPLFLFTLTLALFLYYTQTHWTRIAKHLNKFPGPRIIPLIGNAAHLNAPAIKWQELFSKLVDDYGRVFRFWIAHKPILVVADGKIAEKVLSSENHEKGDSYSAFHRVFEQGLITSTTKKWKKDRKILDPAFFYQYFDGFLKIFNEDSRLMAQIFQETFPTGNEEINLLPYIARCTMDSVFQTVLGYSNGLQRNPEEKYTQRVYGLVHCTREKMFKPWLNFPVIWHLFGLGREEDEHINGAMDELKEIIDAKYKEKATYKQVKGTHTKPFIAFLMDEIDDKRDIAFQINTLYAAGSETTSSGLNYLLYLLALNPSCQQRVQEEVDSVFMDDPERDLTLGDLAELKYSEMCIKEALRIFPPVAGWIRKLDTDVTLDDGRVIPSGCQVAILPWDIHRNPEVYSDPEDFDPERFCGESLIGPSWMPFSTGPRICLGHRYGIMQMKVMLAHVMRHFDVFTTQKRENLKVIYGIVLEPVPEIKMTLRPRAH